MFNIATPLNDPNTGAKYTTSVTNCILAFDEESPPGTSPGSITWTGQHLEITGLFIAETYAAARRHFLPPARGLVRRIINRGALALLRWSARR